MGKRYPKSVFKNRFRDTSIRVEAISSNFALLGFFSFARLCYSSLRRLRLPILILALGKQDEPCMLPAHP